MARRRKPEDETLLEERDRRIKEAIANASTRSEKTSWNRKMDNMVKLLALLRPIEAEILEIIREKKLPIMDQVSELRSTMVNECVHPFEQLVFVDDCVKCKFCETRIGIPRGFSEEV